LKRSVLSSRLPPQRRDGALQAVDLLAQPLDRRPHLTHACQKLDISSRDELAGALRAPATPA